MDEILGLPMHGGGVAEVHAFIEKTICLKKKACVLNLNVHAVNMALNHPWFKNFLNEAEYVFCDGDGVRWGLWLLRQKVPPKITYDRWIWQLADFCALRGYRLFFLGAKPGIASQAAEKLKLHYPLLAVAGTHDGYFDKDGPANEKVIEEINRSYADILIVGFGMPLQEEWLVKNKESLNCHIFLTAGAAFDYASGNFKRAPDWMIRSQMEWLFRLSQEPRRLFKRYGWGIPYFFYHVLKESLKRRIQSHETQEK